MLAATLSACRHLTSPAATGGGGVRLGSRWGAGWLVVMGAVVSLCAGLHVSIAAFFFAVFSEIKEISLEINKAQLVGVPTERINCNSHQAQHFLYSLMLLVSVMGVQFLSLSTCKKIFHLLLCRITT